MPLQRPAQIPWPYLNPNSPLYQGLVFAGLGPHPGGYDFHDCSPYRNHGRLTNMDPPTDWIWVLELGRWALDFDATNDVVNLPAVFSTLDASNAWTISAWIKSAGYVQYGGLVQAYATGLVQTKSTKWGVLRARGDVSVTKCSSSLVTTNVWTHVVGGAFGADGGVGEDANSFLYINGVAESGWQGDPGYAPRNTLGAGYATCNAALSDVLIHNRALFPAEISALADRSNALLVCGGVPLILPLRRWWPVAAVGPYAVAAAQIVQSGVAAGQIVQAGVQAAQISRAGVAAGQIV